MITCSKRSALEIREEGRLFQSVMVRGKKEYLERLVLVCYKVFTSLHYDAGSYEIYVVLNNDCGL